MADLTRWDPASEMMTLRDMMNQLFEDAWVMPRATGGGRGTASFGLPLDVTEDENDFIVKASLPGVNPDDLQVTVNDNMLTIKGELKPEQHDENKRYHLRERRWGSFERTVSLPVSVQADKVEAAYENGILMLKLPKAEEAKPKRIQIKGGQLPKTLEGKANVQRS